MSAYGLAAPPDAAPRAERRAWIVIAVASVLFLILAAMVAFAARYYYIHATQPEEAVAEVIGGSGALWRDHNSDDWTLINGQVEIDEGDEISTTLGTTVWVTFFDGSTAEISEDTVVEFSRMRSSRHVERTKQIVLGPSRGLISVAMASRGEAEYSEVQVNAGQVDVVMSDEPGRADGGSFLVEIVPIGLPGDEETHTIRAAALRGAIAVRTGGESVRVEAGRQVVVEAGGGIGAETGIVRSLILNGDFQDGLDGWQAFHRPEAREATGTSGTVVLQEGPNGQAAVEIARPEGVRVVARTGLQQEIGKTLRPSSTLELSFDVMLEHQGPPAMEVPTVPLVIEIEYLDTLGEEQRWSSGYWLEPAAGLPSPATTTSQIRANAWVHVIFDLANLAPSARHITSVVVYASGTSYRSSIANLALTSSEIGPPSP